MRVDAVASSSTVGVASNPSRGRHRARALAIDARSSRDGRRSVEEERARARRESRANRARTHRIARIASAKRVDACRRRDAATRGRWSIRTYGCGHTVLRIR